MIDFSCSLCYILKITRVIRGRGKGLLRDVEVIRPRWGVPHIYATDPRDLFFAQGFVHIQDRFFQIELRRRLAVGRLSPYVMRSNGSRARGKGNF